MKRILFFLALTVLIGSCSKDDHTYAEIITDFGTMKVMLYNTTPKHRDNFIKLAKEGYYDGLLFHRVMNGFMIQGGDPNSKNASPGQQLGMGGPGYDVDQEIGAPHLKGALAAAQPPNSPQKRSSGSQFYVVQGQPMTDLALDEMEKRQNVTYSPAQRQLYREIGGTPFLDNLYTVFGEVVEGFDVIDKIAAVPVSDANRPVEDVKMTIKIL